VDGFKGRERQRTVDGSMGQDYFRLRVHCDHFLGEEYARDNYDALGLTKNSDQGRLNITGPGRHTS
jgi:hypothetical protein